LINTKTTTESEPMATNNSGSGSQDFTSVSAYQLRRFALDWAVAKAKGLEAAKATDLAEFKRFGFHPSRKLGTRPLRKFTHV
jgi:hypothetical protein